MSGVAVAIGGSALIGAYASKKAGDKQSDAAQAGLDENARLVGPYQEAGAAGIPALQAFVDEGANFSDTRAYKDIVNSAKAGGQSMSGNRLTALTDYYATNFRPQRLNELNTLVRQGQNAAVGQATNAANLFSQQGAGQAAGYLGMANSINSGINSLAFMQQYNQGGGVQRGVNSLLSGDNF